MSTYQMLTTHLNPCNNRITTTREGPASMARDQDKLREYGKDYRERNRDRERDRKAEWYTRNKDEIRERRKMKRAGVTPDDSK